MKLTLSFSIHSTPWAPLIQSKLLFIIAFSHEYSVKKILAPIVLSLLIKSNEMVKNIDKHIMQTTSVINSDKTIPTSFWQSHSVEEINFFLNDSIKLNNGITIWIMKDGKKIIRGGLINEVSVESGSLIITNNSNEDYAIFKGATAIFVYIPGKQRNILFKVFIKRVEDNTIQVLNPSNLYIHELRKEKRIYIPVDKNIQVIFQHIRHNETILRKTRLLDLSSKGVGLFLEMIGDPKIINGEILSITEIPVRGLKIPVQMEVCYIKNYIHAIDANTNLRGFRIGCKFLDQKLDLKKV